MMEFVVACLILFHHRNRIQNRHPLHAQDLMAAMCCCYLFEWRSDSVDAFDTDCDPKSSSIGCLGAMWMKSDTKYRDSSLTHAQDGAHTIIKYLDPSCVHVFGCDTGNKIK